MEIGVRFDLFALALLAIGGGIGLGLVSLSLYRRLTIRGLERLKPSRQRFWNEPIFWVVAVGFAFLVFTNIAV